MVRDETTGNDVRDRCRDLMAKALKKGFDDCECVCVCAHMHTWMCVRVCHKLLGEVKAIEINLNFGQNTNFVLKHTNQRAHYRLLKCGLSN